MATVVIQKRKRKNNCSYPIYYKDPATGRRKYFKTFQRQKDAQMAANDLRALLDNGEMSEIKNSKARLNLFSFEEVGDSLKNDWENRQKRSELSEKTVEGYCYWLKYTEKVFGKKMICEISHEDIVNYRNALALDASNITANRALFVLKQIFLHGLKLNAIKTNPAGTVPYLRGAPRAGARGTFGAA